MQVLCTEGRLPPVAPVARGITAEQVPEVQPIREVQATMEVPMMEALAVPLARMSRRAE